MIIISTRGKNQLVDRGLKSFVFDVVSVFALLCGFSSFYFILLFYFIFKDKATEAGQRKVSKSINEQPTNSYIINKWIPQTYRNERIG